jgi:Carboxypeptidase regulatory-like domain/TonB dependent receptor-like, beta-barrel
MSNINVDKRKGSEVKSARISLVRAGGIVCTREETGMLRESDAYRRWTCAIVLVFAVALGSSTALGQVDTGTILGTVKDMSGALIPNARVTLTNEATGIYRTISTGTDGTYVFSPVRVGTYSVSVEVEGFEKAIRDHITLDVQQHVAIDITMVTGTVVQRVEVKSDAVSLQTQTASLQQVVGSRAINDLPLNGRNATFLAQLAVGVSDSQADSRGLAASGGFAANGVRPAQNNYLLDGMDNNSNIFDLVNQSYFVLMPPPDALQEFSVQTNNFSAEFGHSAGAVLNAVTKSGTNQFHGDLWEYLRNDKLDAADYFLSAAGQPKAEFRQNQFGFTLGGPVGRPGSANKTFFFVDYQGTRIRQGIPYVVTVPTAAERQSGFMNFQDLITGQTGKASGDALGRSFPLGTIFDPATTRAVTTGQVDGVTGLTAASTGYVRDPFYTGSLAGTTDFTSASAMAGLNLLPAQRLDSNAIKLLNLFPDPTNAGIANNLTTAPRLSLDSNTFDVRVDHNFSDKDMMFGRYSYAKSYQIYPGALPGIADGAPARPGSGPTLAQDIALSETHIFSPTFINEARIGYSRLHDVRVQFGGNDLSNIPAQYGIQGIPQFPENGGLPSINIGGYSNLGGGGSLPSDKYSIVTQVTDNLTKVKGGHTLRMGFEFQDVRFPGLAPPSSRGAFVFSGQYTSVVTKTDASTGVAQLLLSPIPTTVAGGVNNVGGANTVRGTNYRPVSDFRRVYVAGYLQDNWRVNSKLSLNLGLRYDVMGRPSEHSGQEANLTGPGFGTGSFRIASSVAGIAPPAFLSLLAQDGITYNPTDGPVWQAMSYGDFGPRVGFAYQFAPKFVIRGGYALFYGGQENYGLASRGAFNFPFQISGQYNAANSVTPITPDNSIGSLENGLVNVPLSLSSITNFATFERAIPLYGSDLKWKDPTVSNYNLAVEVQLSSSTTMTLAYAGSDTHHLQVGNGVAPNSVNQIVPPNLSIYNFVPYPDFSTTGSYHTDNGDANYNSFQFNIERKFASSLAMLGNYTYSKCLSDARDILNNDIGNYRAPFLPNFGIRQDYSSCDFDIRNIVHFSGTYDLPWGKGKRFLNHGGVTNAVIGGWSINWTLTLQDGKPFSIGCPIATTTGLGCFAVKVPGQNVIGGPHNVNQWMNPAAFANPVPATAVGQTDYAPLGGPPGQVVGPGFHRLDFSVFKRFNVSESKAFEFRAEAFNLTNTPDFANPTFTNFTVTSTFGKITSTVNSPNDPRQIQMALKFYF